MSHLIRWIVGVSSSGILVSGGCYLLTHHLVTNTSDTLSRKKQELKTVDVTSPKFKDGYLAKLYGKYFLDTNFNQETWKDIFDKKIINNNTSYRPGINFNSASVTSAFSENENYNTHLNNRCKEYYQKEIKGADDDSSGKIDPKGDDWKDVWELCSIWSPVFLDKLNSSKYEEESIGKKRATELLSTQENEDLWTEKDKDFFDLSTTPIEEMFKELYETKHNETRGSLREKCEEAYKIKSTGGNPSTRPSEEDVVRYCSMKPIKT